MDTLELEEVFRFPRWSPLSTIVGSIRHDQFFGEALYRIGDRIYLGASQWCGPNLETGPGGPFVTGVIWAADEGALRRATEFDIEADGGTIAELPRAFLPANAEATYRSILDALKQGKPLACLETASYRIASDGQFMYRSIETESFHFYFRSRKHDDDEPPFVVARKLPQR